MTLIQFFNILLVPLSGVLSYFCFSLTRKLRKLNNLESGIGAAIAVMVTEVRRLEKALESAKHEASAKDPTLKLTGQETKINLAGLYGQKDLGQREKSGVSRLRRQKRKQGWIDA